MDYICPPEETRDPIGLEDELRILLVGPEDESSI
jgi:hypothetical protein